MYSQRNAVSTINWEKHELPKYFDLLIRLSYIVIRVYTTGALF